MLTCPALLSPPQVLAVVTSVNARLDAMEATVSALADSGGRLDALEADVATLQADLADGQANFQAVRGPALAGPLPTTPPRLAAHSLLDTRMCPPRSCKAFCTTARC